MSISPGRLYYKFQNTYLNTPLQYPLNSSVTVN